MASPFEPSPASSPSTSSLGIASTSSLAPPSSSMAQPTAHDWYILRTLHQQIYGYQHALFRPHDGPHAVAPIPMHVAIPPPPDALSLSSSSSSLAFALPMGSPPPLPSGPLPTILVSPNYAPAIPPDKEMRVQAPLNRQQRPSQPQQRRPPKISKGKKKLEKQLKQGLLARKQMQLEKILLNYDTDTTPTANKIMSGPSTKPVTTVPPLESAISETTTSTAPRPVSHSIPSPSLVSGSTNPIPMVPLAEEAPAAGDATLSTASIDQVRSEEVLRAMLKGGLARSKVLSTKQPATAPKSATSSLTRDSANSAIHVGNDNARIGIGAKDKGKRKAPPQEIEVITLDDDDDGEIEEGEIPVDPVERRKSRTTQSPTAKKSTAAPIPIPFPQPRPKKRRKSFEVEIEDMDGSPPRGDFEYDQVPRGPRHQMNYPHQRHDLATSPSSHLIQVSPLPLVPPPWSSRIYDRWADQEPGEVLHPIVESSQSPSKSVPQYSPQQPFPPQPHNRFEQSHQFQQSQQQRPFPQQPPASHPPPPPKSPQQRQMMFNQDAARSRQNDRAQWQFERDPYHGYEPPVPIQTQKTPLSHPFHAGQASPAHSYFSDPRPSGFGANSRPPL
ncbi:BQ2448_1316 [Microbotryum intermedium]|uniref:BQ2448_1316 protein n=1 Tax=Microbotryum intermedium TaxID=269621 RepID=A0A238F7S6_9BASI|nr:BQ2448_1316 [Microbotryum intermedium]